MSRFLLAPEAQNDLDRIKDDLNTLPAAPAFSIALSTQEALELVAQNPSLGKRHTELSRQIGSEIRSLLCRNHRIFYRVGATRPEILALFHTAQDISSIMFRRLQ